MSRTTQLSETPFSCAALLHSITAMEATSAVSSRRELPGAVDSKLFFAQVREDPLLEIDALVVKSDETAVVVSSGGCTALSLLACGAGNVVAVDLSKTQNSLVEVKAAAVSTLSRDEAMAFLGGAPADAAWRRSTYARLRGHLTATAQLYWDSRAGAVERGVLNIGVTERFLAAVVKVVRTTIHPPARIRRLLACRTLDDQRALYDTEWNNRRWRLLFTVLLNRAVFRRTYDPSFFANVENPSFSRHFHRLAEHGLTNVPVQSNYFLHHMLTGAYPRDVDSGVPPYLAGGVQRELENLGERLHLVDGSYLDYLKGCSDSSIDAFSLSNICEWLDPAQIDDLMGEIVRTAAPGARLVFRNFVGWTDVPPQWRGVIVEDTARGDALVARDRSMMQRRIAVCHVMKGAT